MATETTGRPRPWLLGLLGIVVLVFITSRMFSSGPTPSAAVETTPPSRAKSQGPSGPIDPAALDIRIEELKAASGESAEAGRNPFRFQPKAPPPPRPEPPGSGRPARGAEEDPPAPTGPPAPQPIGATIKFIGIVVQPDGSTLAAFSDCRATFPGREGEILEGRYRIVRIGVESAVLEYPDGTGRTTLPLNGQACVK